MPARDAGHGRSPHRDDSFSTVDRDHSAGAYCRACTARCRAGHRASRPAGPPHSTQANRQSRGSRGRDKGETYRHRSSSKFRRVLGSFARVNELNTTQPWATGSDGNRRCLTLPALASMSAIAERPLGTEPATAQGDRGLSRQVPLLPIDIYQGDRSFHPKWPVRPYRDLDRRHCSLTRRRAF